MSHVTANQNIKRGLVTIAVCVAAILVFASFAANSPGSGRGYVFAAKLPAYGALYGLWLLGKGLWVRFRERRHEESQQFMLSSDANELTQQLLNIHSKWQKIGADLADDCFANHLAKGKPVLVSQLVALCHSIHGDRGPQVEFGLLNRLNTHIESGDVRTVAVEGEDAVLVHKDHVRAFLDSLDAR